MRMYQYRLAPPMYCPFFIAKNGDFLGQSPTGYCVGYAFITLANYFLGRGGGGGGGDTSMSSNEMPVIPFLNPSTIRPPFSNHVCLRSMMLPSLENETHTTLLLRFVRPKNE